MSCTDHTQAALSNIPANLRKVRVLLRQTAGRNRLRNFAAEHAEEGYRALDRLSVLIMLVRE